MGRNLLKSAEIHLDGDVFYSFPALFSISISLFFVWPADPEGVKERQQCCGFEFVATRHVLKDTRPKEGNEIASAFNSQSHSSLPRDYPLRRLFPVSSHNTS